MAVATERSSLGAVSMACAASGARSRCCEVFLGMSAGPYVCRASGSTAIVSDLGQRGPGGLPVLLVRAAQPHLGAANHEGASGVARHLYTDANVEVSTCRDHAVSECARPCSS